ncbi:MAG: AAA family ATPase [Deltaproteobacteria bacterium]|nr:AAA family ATPase [Deltaproteobacteria bacterium]
MKIFVIVGMPASGKNIARIYAESNDFIYYATGDIVRAEVRRRGVEADPVETAAISDELRGEDGMGVTRLALEEVLKSGAAVGFLEGMRSWPEIELIREKADCEVVAFLAPRQMRLERICARGREDDSPQAFDDRDRREIGYGAAIPIALADAYILNTATLEEAISQLDTIVKQ